MRKNVTYYSSQYRRSHSLDCRPRAPVPTPHFLAYLSQDTLKQLDTEITAMSMEPSQHFDNSFNNNHKQQQSQLQMPMLFVFVLLDMGDFLYNILPVA